MTFPSPADLKNGHLAFKQHEGRDAMYKIATFLVQHFWGNASDMADSLGVLLLTWNQAFYRHGPFDFDELEKCISSNLELLSRYRKSNILDYTESDDEKIRHLFDQFLDALKIRGGKRKGVKSPVGVAKALHLLAPEFFPLWDEKIARAYGYYYSSNSVEKYLAFLRMTKDMVRGLQARITPKPTSRELLKLIDEYNYSKYTKGWL
jgi:hypothetical protein